MDQAVLEVRALRHKPKLEDISFTLRRGEVLGIAGLLGAGRSELLKAIVGLETYDRANCYQRREDHAPRLRRHAETRHWLYARKPQEAGIIPWWAFMKIQC